MVVSGAYQSHDELWNVAVHHAHADELLEALDPECPHVLIETSDGISDWHEVEVSIGPAPPCRRLVRRHAFDLLVTPEEAIGIGMQLRAQGLSGGGLRCFQFREKPRWTFDGEPTEKAFKDALRGHGAVLMIDLPHDGETAVARAVERPVVEAYRRRLL